MTPLADQTSGNIISCLWTALSFIVACLLQCKSLFDEQHCKRWHCGLFACACTCVHDSMCILTPWLHIAAATAEHRPTCSKLSELCKCDISPSCCDLWVSIMMQCCLQLTVVVPKLETSQNGGQNLYAVLAVLDHEYKGCLRVRTCMNGVKPSL